MPEYIHIPSKVKKAHLMPREMCSFITDMTQRTHRDQHEWNMIMMTLNSYDLVTALPQTSSPDVRKRFDVLSICNSLMLFTEIQRCVQFLEKLRLEEPSLSFTLAPASANDTVMHARLSGKNVFFNFACDEIPSRNLVYMPSIDRIHCIITLNNTDPLKSILSTINEQIAKEKK